MEEANRYVTWAVHNEFARRLDEENMRQSTRISDLEASVREIGQLTVSVGKMAVSLENMASEMKKQGERLTMIEQRPAKRWDAVITGIIGAVVGAVCAALMAGIIH